MLHVVVNPVAGRGRARATWPRVRAGLEASGVAFEVFETTGPHHATDLAAATPDGATVVAVGGDGTAHEVARGLLGSDRVLALVPVGSGDDVAHALGLPRGDADAALRALLHGRTRTIDTGVCNGEPFLNALGVGLDAEVGRRVHDAPRPLRGVGAYLWAVAVALRRLDVGRMRVEVVDAVRGTERTVHDGPALLVSTQNGPRTGGSFRFAPMASLDDGHLDLIVAGDLTRRGTLALLPRAIAGRHLHHPKVAHHAVRRVRIDAATPRTWHADGEAFPPATSFAIEVRPASLRVRAP